MTVKGTARKMAVKRAGQADGPGKLPRFARGWCVYYGVHVRTGCGRSTTTASPCGEDASKCFELVGGFYPVMSIRRVNLWDESGWDYSMSNIHCAMDTLLIVLSF